MKLTFVLAAITLALAALPAAAAERLPAKLVGIGLGRCPQIQRRMDL